MQPANWDRAIALHTAHAVDSQEWLSPLFQLARNGNSAELLSRLTTIQQNTSLSAPQRDYLMFSFLQGLGDLDPNTVDAEVLDYLSGYQAGTLVEHDDFSAVGVPLFNVRGAAAGVRTAWSRQLAQDRALRLFQETSEHWISAYLAADPVERRGMTDAMNLASNTQLRQLGWAALTQLDERPNLTLIAAQAGLMSGDFDLLLQSISQGSGPDMARILSMAASQLKANEALQILDQSIRNGSDSKAALAIAQLAPMHLDEAEVRQLIFATLSSQSLGAAASMVLGASSDPEIQRQLTEIASGQEGLAKQRASLAISVGQFSPGEVQ